MGKVSILIPARNEIFLSETINEIYRKAKGDFEIIVGLDGYWPEQKLEDRDNIHIIHTGEAKGMRYMINSAAAIAKGDYLLKMDAHCAWEEGFDIELQKEHEDNWIVIPRRYSMDVDSWIAGVDSRQLSKGPYDYHYFDCPMMNQEYFQFHGVVWKERTRDPMYKEIDIDDNPSFQGSAWFMTKNHFLNFLGGMSEEGYGSFAQEAQEIGTKTWLGGGAVKVNKRTWYSHLHKGSRFGRMYSMSNSNIENGKKFSADYWFRNKWEKRVHDIEWLIEKFMPMPGWPLNWEELLREYRSK